MAEKDTVSEHAERESGLYRIMSAVKPSISDPAEKASAKLLTNARIVVWCLRFGERRREGGVG